MNIIGHLALIIPTLYYFGLASMAVKQIPGVDKSMGFEGSMDQTHTFYDGQFYSETEAILQTIAKFQDFSVDYVPAVQKLRKALHTPLKLYQQAANLRCILLLDGWLKKHE